MSTVHIYVLYVECGALSDQGGQCTLIDDKWLGDLILLSHRAGGFIYCDDRQSTVGPPESSRRLAEGEEHYSGWGHSF